MILPVKLHLTTPTEGHTNEYLLVNYTIKDLDNNPIDGYTVNFLLINDGPYNNGDVIGIATISELETAGAEGQFQIEIENPFRPRGTNNTYPTPKLPHGDMYRIRVLHNYGDFNNMENPPPLDADELREP